MECGNALKTNAITNIQKAIEELVLARANPAKVPKVSETTTTPKVTITEFLK